MMFAFSKLEPITEPRSSHPLLADIESHLTRQQFAYYCNSGNLTTDIHEGSHGVAANGRNKIVGNDHNFFYVFNNQYAYFAEPKFRKRQVAEFIADEWKQYSLYGTYVTGASAWEDSPLYLLEEGNAYSLGAQAGESDSEIEFATVFGFYSLAVIEAAEKHDPEYYARQTLGEFVDWQIYRLAYTVAQHGNDKHKRLLDRLTSAAGLS